MTVYYDWGRLRTVGWYYTAGYGDQNIAATEYIQTYFDNGHTMIIMNTGSNELNITAIELYLL